MKTTALLTIAAAFALTACGGDDDSSALTPEALVGKYELSSYRATTRLEIVDDGEREETFDQLDYVEGDAAIEYRADGTWEATGTAVYDVTSRYSAFDFDTVYQVTLAHVGSGRYDVVDDELRGVQVGPEQPSLDQYGLEVAGFDTDLSDGVLRIIGRLVHADMAGNVSLSAEVAIDGEYIRQ